MSNPNPVGYGNPPVQRRFKASGNPKGRPKGALNRKTIVEMVANETHDVTENGKRRRFTILQLVFIRLRNMMLESSNPRAFDEYHRLIKAYQPQDPDNKCACLVVPAEISAEEWMANAERKNEIMAQYGVRTLAEAYEIDRQLKKGLKPVVRPLDPDSYGEL